jgi:hypothetical protein
VGCSGKEKIELQAAGGLLQVADGGLAGAVRIARADGLEHGDVFLVHGGGQAFLQAAV